LIFKIFKKNSKAKLLVSKSDPISHIATKSIYYCGFGDALRKNYNGLQHVIKSAKNNVLARTAVNLQIHGCN
jgi:hypothetical protein